jgi:hypothetical protein
MEAGVRETGEHHRIGGGADPHRPGGPRGECGGGLREGLAHGSQTSGQALSRSQPRPDSSAPGVEVAIPRAGGLKDPKRSASRIAKYDLAVWIGIEDTPEDIVLWKKEIQRELDEMGSTRRLDDGSFDMCSMIWFTITDEPTDQTPNRKLSNLLVGTEAQVTDNLKRFKEAGYTAPFVTNESMPARTTTV